LQHRKRRESEGGKNRGKKIVMVKLIIQKDKKKHQVQKQKVQSFGKSSGVIP
jgi:hypothetical protein